MADDNKKTVKKWGLTFISGAFAIALAMLYVLVLRSVAVQITPPPGVFDEPYPDVGTMELCEEAGGRWTDVPERVTEPGRPEPIVEKSQPFCRGPLAFERERQIVSEASEQTSLFVFAVGGALAVASSLLIVRIRPVAPGLMIGGIVSFFIAGVHIWRLTPGIGRLVTIVVIFLLLVGIGMYVFKEKDEEEASV